MATLRELRWGIQQQLHLLIDTAKTDVIYKIAASFQDKVEGGLPDDGASDVELCDFIVDFLRSVGVSAMWSGIVQAWMNQCRWTQEATREIPTSQARTHQVQLGHRDVTALLDPGSAVTLMHPDFVQTQGTPARPLALPVYMGIPSRSQGSG
ncbi:hypothetical protein AAFF_G00394090 [Aldrovandia affinis]|uniref:Uncharacterized protein n=1 Tax=Aldrovandia affinis TaxID=143900 RepID=A0AAD7SDL4_9TELE|nr:hypothetical protein AAFF_G00394090 [Aldrovandia affinis]